jgi:ATP-dependent RNA helicase DeaD
MHNHDAAEPDVAAATPEDVQAAPANPLFGARRFADFALSQELLRGIAELGWDHTTPVQSATIEAALAGKDLVVRAKTGTGKTGAFCVPAVERIAMGERVTRAIILAPTRELAQQTHDVLVSMCRERDITVVSLVGGMPMGAQERALEAGPAVVVGTPGRVLDHLRRRNLSLADAQTVVLDEADEMLSMGFVDDVCTVLEACGADSQKLLFSATISPETQRIVERYLRSPEQILLSTDADPVEGIEHIVYDVPPGFHKTRALLYLLDLEDPASAIIFCNTREDAALVASFLDRQGLDAQLLSGELPQTRRNWVMAQVKAGAVRFLVATDVAARGIDITDLSHVIQYSLPPDPAIYMHRTGRTGRIGKKGIAIALAGPTDMGTRKTLQFGHGIAFIEKSFPDEAACVARRVDGEIQRLRNAMGSIVFEAYLPAARALMSRPDGEVLIAGALRAFIQWDRRRRAEMAGPDAAPPEDARPARGDSRGKRRSDEPRRADAREAKPAPRPPEARESKPEGRGDRRERPRRGEKPARSQKSALLDDLDALLLSEDTAPVVVAPSDDLDIDSLLSDGAPALDAPEAGASDAADADAGDDGDKKKKKRRRRKKKASAGDASSPESADDGASDEGGAADVASALDDFDALLSMDD